MADGVAGPRMWGGQTTSERQAVRYRRLIEAGITLVADGGGQAVTVRAVCREAGLTSRYFYEQFSDREEFTAAVYHSVASECRNAVREAVDRAGTPGQVATAAVDAVVGLSLDDPRKGRVLFVAPSTDPLLFAHHVREFPIMGEMIAAHISTRGGREIQELKAASLVGALGHDFGLYVGGQLDVSREVFVAHCVALLVSVAAI